MSHTADLALEIWAPDEPALLDAAARALVSILTGGGKVAALATRTLRVESVDAEDRLVRWLNAVLLLALVDRFLPARAELTLRPDGLDAVVHGDPDASGKIVAEVKSVTYHALSLRRSRGRWRARVVIDV